jgi:hypothetical protein
MPSRSESRRSQLSRWIAENQPALVDSVVLERIRTDIGPVSDSYLRQMVKASGVALSAEVEGVSTSSLEEAERTLLALCACYAEGQHAVRALVIEARKRLRWALERAPDAEKGGRRTEMMLWTLTWLENPLAFPAWLALRKRALAVQSPSCSAH